MFYIKKISQQAFTLIELLVVIAIIGILSSVVLASLSGARESARDARRVSDLNQIRTAMEQIHLGCGEYPDGRVSGPAGGGQPIMDPATGAPLPPACSGHQLDDVMTTIPYDPLGEDTDCGSGPGIYECTYGYGSSADRQSYCLAVSLEGDTVPDDNASTSIAACSRAVTATAPDNGGAPYTILVD